MVSTRGELGIMLIYSFAFVLCYFFSILFPKNQYLTKETNVYDKTTTWTINRRQLRIRNELFLKKNQNLKTIKILALQWEKRDVVVQNNWKRVVHTTPTTRAEIRVLSKLTWHLCKWMHLHFSSQHLHITKLRLVI